MSTQNDNLLGAIVRVSTDSNGGQANGYTETPLFSPDGTKLIFSSRASNLVADDTNFAPDVFIKDLVTGAITRLSTASGGQQANGYTLDPVFSPDGDKVAFWSDATNLVDGDTNGTWDVFVKDLTTGETTRISTDTAGGQANAASYAAVFSPDGRQLIFWSDATNLASGDANGRTDLFIKDLTTGHITRAPTNSLAAPLMQQSMARAISPDGKMVAFTELSSNLFPYEAPPLPIMVKNLTSGATEPVSTSSGGLSANDDSLDPVFSPDGRWLLFTSYGDNLVPDDTNGVADVFLKDLATGAITRLSNGAAGEQANGGSRAAVFSPDGTTIAFESDASNLVSGDTNGMRDIFIKDLETGAVSRVSLDGAGNETNGMSFAPSFSPDGSKIAFLSSASDLVAGDTNAANDVFVKTIVAGPTLSIVAADAARAEGQTGTTQFNFVVTRSGDTSIAQSVSWSVVGAGLKQANASDFIGGVLPSGVLTFAVGETSKTIAIGIAPDTIIEPDETFAVGLSAPTGGAVLASKAAFAIIQNDDGVDVDNSGPILSIAPAAAVESDNGDKSVVFTVTLDRASSVAVGINYATVNGSATAGADYVGQAGTLTIAAGAVTGTITIPILGDTVYEHDESFSLVLSNPTGATFYGAAQTLSATGTIQNDDASDIVRVSTAADGSQANSESFAPVFSQDGTKIAFVSAARTLVSGDTNDFTDIFVKDLATGVVTRVSTSTAGDQPNNLSSRPMFSPDGSKVAFISFADNLVAGDDNGAFDIFVKDLATGAITRVPSGEAGRLQINGLVRSPQFSPDGTQIGFYSEASSLVAGDTNDDGDLFIMDLKTGAITRASTGAAGQQANNESGDLAFSADGTKIAFTSWANNLVSGDMNGTADVFVKDLASGAVTLVSASSSGAQGNASNLAPVFSPDGRYVAFSSDASNLVANDTNGKSDIFIKDLVTGAIQRVSTDGLGEQADGASYNAAFSADGTKILFESTASNLVDGDTNGAFDVFLKDLSTGAIVRLSVDGIETQANGANSQAKLSADGTKVMFGSAASNLVAGDTNGAADVFIKTLIDGAAFSITAPAIPTKAEGSAGATPFTFVVTRAGDAGTAQSVNWSVTGSGITKASASDFVGGVLPNGILTFAAGETAKTIAIDVAGDALFEASEGFAVTLSAPTGGAILASEAAFVTILNDDASSVPVASIANVAMAEGYDSGKSLLFTVTLDKPAATATKVSYATVDGSALAGLDYAATSGVLTIAAGATSGTVTVPILGDTVYEYDESFLLTLSNPTGVVFSGGAVTLAAAAIIRNDDGIVGTPFDDVLVGMDGDDPLDGGHGNDLLSAEGGNDTLNGGAGDDVLRGGSGADWLDGSSGFDLATYDTSPAGVVVRLDWQTGQGGDASGDGFRGIEGVVGSSFADELQGDYLGNQLFGGGGDDVLSGLDGSDALFGGDGTDTMAGGAAGDILWGGTGADAMDGGSGVDYAVYDTSTAGVVVRLDLGTGSGGDAAGDTLVNIEGLVGSAFADTLVGNHGDNTLVGNDGADTLQGLGGADAMAGGAGDDVLLGNDGRDAMDGGIGNDFISGDSGSDTLLGGIGDDFLRGGSDGDWMDGGAGLDFALYDTSAAGVAIRLDIGAGLGGDATGDALTGIEGVVGSSFADALLGSDGDNQLLGGDGDDVLAGLAGNDLLSGGAGSDLLLGDIGADVLAGGAGADTLVGGAGADIFYFAVADNAAGVFDVITDFQDGEDLIYLQGWNAATLAAVDVDGNAVLTTTDSGYMTGVVILGATAAQVMDQVQLI